MLNIKQYDLDSKHIDIVGVFEFDKKEIDQMNKPIGGGDTNRLKWSELEQEKKDELNKVRSLQRTKSKVRRLVISQNMRYMWTLTFNKKYVLNGNNEEKDTGNLDDVWDIWRAFIKKCKRSGVEFKYIVTVEVQEKRLATYNEKVYHFHFVTDMALPVNSKKAKQMKLDYNILDLWGYGYVFVSSSNRGKSFAARYITKYISKMFDECGKSTHRYRCSKGMVVPCQKARFKSEVELDIYVVELAKKQNLEMKKEYYEMMGGEIEILVYILTPKPYKNKKLKEKLIA